MSIQDKFSHFLRHYNWFWIPTLSLVLVILLFYKVIPGSSAFHSWYVNYAYYFVRWYLHIIFGSVGLNGFWVCLGILVSYLVFQIFLWIRHRKRDGIHLRQILRIVLIPIYLGLLFYLQWGFHYGSPTLTQRLNLDVKLLSEKRMLEEVRQTMESMLSIRFETQIDTSISMTEGGWGAPNDSTLYTQGESIFLSFGLPTYGAAVVKPLLPPGFLYRLNTSGFYNPLTGECNVEADLHPLQQAFVKAHEWTHAQGITDEGDANFLAYWICVSSDEPEIAYSGHLSYWRYLMRDLRKNFPEHYEEVQQKVPLGIRKDLQEINESINKYPEFMPRLRDVTYNTYLKTQGVSDGMASYNRIVIMVVAHKRAKRI